MKSGIIIISGELLEKLVGEVGSNDISLLSVDGGDVYTMLQEIYPQAGVPGSLYCATQPKQIPVTAFGKPEDRVRLIAYRSARMTKELQHAEPKDVTGYVLLGKEWESVPVQVVPVKGEIFSRSKGLLETDRLAGKRVSIFGLGSGGSPIAVELAKAGVMDFYLMDHDRLEVANVARHVAGISHVGRYKTKVMADMIREKNPYARIHTWEEKVSFENHEVVREMVRKADVNVCATDSRPSRLIINRLCVEENRPCVFAGASRRAYGGQILRVRPYISPCYQCFCSLLPEKAEDQEISRQEQAENRAYSDRPVPIEPGLASDIAPISIMVVKIIINELLGDVKSTLHSLDKDLIAPWYLWLNRREPGTPYEKLKPMGYNVNVMSILRWYGIDLRRHPGCPVCGDFEAHVAKEEGIEVPNSQCVLEPTEGEGIG